MCLNFSRLNILGISGVSKYVHTYLLVLFRTHIGLRDLQLQAYYLQSGFHRLGGAGGKLPPPPQIFNLSSSQSKVQ